MRINDLENNYVQFQPETNGLAMHTHTDFNILKENPTYGRTADIVQKTTLDGVAFRARPPQYSAPVTGVVYRPDHVAKPAAITGMFVSSAESSQR